MAEKRETKKRRRVQKMLIYSRYFYSFECLVLYTYTIYIDTYQQIYAWVVTLMQEQLEKETQQTDMQQTAGSSQAVYPDMPPPSIPSTATVEPQVSVSTSGPPLETEGVTGTVGVDGNTERVPIVKEQLPSAGKPVDKVVPSD